MERRKPIFVRQDWHKHMRLGQKLKKYRKWRAAKGSSSKVRKGRKGHPKRPKIGWGSERKTRNLINGTTPVKVDNMAQLMAAKKGNLAVFGSFGMKKRIEMLAKAKELGVVVLNKYYTEKKDEAK